MENKPKMPFSFENDPCNAYLETAKRLIELRLSALERWVTKFLDVIMGMITQTSAVCSSHHEDRS